MPLFMLLIFGIFEMGLLYRDSLTNHNATKAGARAASVNGSGVEADYLVLRSIEHGVSAIGLENLDHVVVFKASGPGDDVPPGCTASSQVGLCNRYDAASFFKAFNSSSGERTTNFGCTESVSIDRYWCPASRSTVLGTSDYVGVHLQSRHSYLTGFFGATSNLRDTTVIRLEPTAYS